MNQPTAKHREEARELARATTMRYRVVTGRGISVRDEQDWIKVISVTLSSRDREIREVLEGLVRGSVSYRVLD